MVGVSPLPVVIAILSPPHSGSTLLDLLLGSHPDVLGLGEVKGLRGKKKRGPRVSKILRNRCACGADPAIRCSFWRAIDDRLHERGFDLATLPIDSKNATEFTAANRALLEVVREVTGRSFVVDSSKSIRRFQRLRRIPDLDLRPILLVREPAAVVHSGNRKGRPWIRTTSRCIRYWIAARRAVRGLDPLVVRYEELATGPGAELSRIVEAYGLEPDPRQLDWRAQPHHHFAGNRLRYAETSAIVLDDEWTRELSRAKRLLISIAVRPYLPPSARSSPRRSPTRRSSS